LIHAPSHVGRANQKKRTRKAIVDACRELIDTGGEVTMPEVARRALVSEATAYRYFPDLLSLLSEALAEQWPTPPQMLEPVAASTDPVERIAFACDYLSRHVLAYAGAVRAMISATITHPVLAGSRPGLRFGLIDEALTSLNDTLGRDNPERLAQLKRDLAVVVSAEALFSLTDLCGLSAEDAVASLVRTATTLTTAAIVSVE